MEHVGHDGSPARLRHATLSRGAASLTATARRAEIHPHVGHAGEGVR
jgi:hypothetical protein